MSKVLPPGPRGNRFTGRAVALGRRDPLNFMTGVARDYGDVSSFRVGSERVFFLNHPDHVREVFLNHYGGFLKGRGNQRMKRFLGEGLLLSEGDTHRRQRRLAQPAFHRQRLAAYAGVMAEMLRLTLAIVGKTLFSADVESEADEVGRAMMGATQQFRAFKLPLSALFERLPLPHLRRFQTGKGRLQQIILRVIEERRRDGVDHGDLLSMLLLAQDEGAGGERMTPAQVWDEALTIFIAGYDTMGVALMWTWYALSQHPEVEARLHAEVDEVLADGRPATLDDLGRLTYTDKVLAESMRL